MESKCHNCEEKQACIPFFQHENTMMHYNMANRRMLIALVAVLVTTAVIVMVFTSNQTKREQMWQDTIKSIVNQTTVAEVDNGQQDADH